MMPCINASEISSMQMTNTRHNLTALEFLTHLSEALPEEFLRKHLVAISSEPLLSRGRCTLHFSSHESLILASHLLSQHTFQSIRCVPKQPIHLSFCQPYQSLLSRESAVSKDSVLYCSDLLQQIADKRALARVDVTDAASTANVLVHSFEFDHSTTIHPSELRFPTASTSSTMSSTI